MKSTPDHAKSAHSATSPAYLDYAATSPLLPSVYTAMSEVLTGLAKGEFGNASALHTPGQRAHSLIEDARCEVAYLINADPSEITFTSGGSEANNTVMHTFAGQRITVSSIEHPSVLEPARAYAGELTVLPVDEWGRVKLSVLPSHADLVSVMLANNELGTIEPLPEIAETLQKRCKNYNNHDRVQETYLHTDATQALGKIPIDVKALGVDYLTCSAHKIGGPVGVAALYVRQGSPLTPLILGGHQENKMRAGTSNLLAITGFGAAAKWCREHDSPALWRKAAALRDQLKDRILAEVPYSSVNTPDEEALPNILNVSFQAAEGESIQLYLDAAGVAVSTGSACAAGDLRPSHVLMAARGDAEVAHSSIRFSLGLDTTPADLDRVMAALPNIIKRLQAISTVEVKSR